ncbi:unnamed protein product [Medioppia subpectinata]|uniref:Nerve growth factor-related domain-containing protein n=1 Tax=Medioppia subpectinata TaxID=1979941 RepID=A0A7R9PWJ9_9ACAR|nr:unnamed protein product [Medioppia subpectinata]CAG2104015.1 unnamed protein product [Medioppia subpectinata]
MLTTPTPELRADEQINKEWLNRLSIRPGMVEFSAKKPRSSPVPEWGSRSKRKASTKLLTELIQDVCPSVSDWVARSEALDPYGNKLTIVQRIPINGTVINQYFYETFCSYDVDSYGYDNQHSNHMSPQCRGIDKRTWSSRCKENHIWTYGKVITNSGDIGWSVIAIRGSCGCAIWPKVNEVMGVGRGRRLSPNQLNREDNHLLADPFF